MTATLAEEESDVNTTGRLGPGKEDTKSHVLLNRIVEWSSRGTWHAEMSLLMGRLMAPFSIASSRRVKRLLLVHIISRMTGQACSTPTTN